MNWHVITRIGSDDPYAPAIPDAEPRIEAGFARSGDRWEVRNDAQREIFDRAGNLPLPAAVDLLYLAMAAYAADLRVPRRLRPDRWTRDLVVHFPVQDLPLWSAHAAHAERMLGFLTGDRWALRLRAREAVDTGRRRSTLDQVQAVCLFSGGLDSLIGATDLLHAGRFVALVGHHGAGITNSVQGRVLAAVREAFGPAAAAFMLHAQPPKNKIDEAERSMRSRSFLFLAMGVGVASALGGGQPLYVPENGLISLNVPLTSARSGSRSTRTTHPHYLAMFQGLLDRLGLRHRIEVPYRFRTKGEMLREARAQRLVADVAKLTMSCSHPEMGRYRYGSANNHCGYCVPCIIRRASMRAAGLTDAPYNVDVSTGPPAHDTESGSDFRAFEMAVERVRGMAAGRAAFEVLRSGPLPPQDVTEFAAVFLRGMEEVRQLVHGGNG